MNRGHTNRKDYSDQKEEKCVIDNKLKLWRNLKKKLETLEGDSIAMWSSKNHKSLDSDLM